MDMHDADKPAVGDDDSKEHRQDDPSDAPRRGRFAKTPEKLDVRQDDEQYAESGGSGLEAMMQDVQQARREADEPEPGGERP